MMRKIFICFLMGFLINVQAQFQLAGSYEYGQILDVVYHPEQENTIYGRTINNHIVKSTDLGETWEVIHSVPQENWYITVKDLRLTSDGNSLSYICVAEGTAWNRVEILNLATEELEKEIVSPIGAEPGSLLQSYSLAKDNTDIALFHTTKFINWGLITEIYYTTNGGVNWTMVYYGPANGDINVNNVAISPYNSQRLFIMRGASPNSVEGGLLISENGGQTWAEKIPNTNFSAIAFHPENQNEIYLGTYYLGSGQEQNLYKSTDAGTTWNVVPMNWTGGSTNSIHTILYNPSDYENILILEENEIVISNDGGQTWENNVHLGTDYENIYFYGVSASFNPFNEDQVIISANYYPFISNDGGANIQKLRTPFLNGSLRMSKHINDEKHIYYGLRSGIVHVDLETGEENAQGMLPLGQFTGHTRSGAHTDAHKLGRVFFSNSAMMGNSSLFMSDDHGANFSSVYTGSYLFLIAQASLPSNPDKTLISFGEMLVKMDLTDPANPLSEELTLPSFGYVETMLYDADENSFFIAQQNKVYKSIDGGQNWNDSSAGLESLTNEDFTYDLKRNPLNHEQLGLATSKGVFISNDNGANWTQIYENGPMNRVEFSPFAEGKIVASSRFEDGSFYTESISKTVYSKNGGESWTEISADELGFLRTISTEIVFHDENSADTYFLVPDLGLVQYTLDLTLLGVSNENILSEVTLYPNPTSGILNIHSEKEVQNLVIFDLNGKKINEQKSSRIDVSFLPKGVYIVQIKLLNGKVETKKLVKK